MRFEREISEKILRLSETFPAVVLTGARQVGKTWLLERLFPNHTLVSLDLPSIAALAETNGEDFLKRYPPPVVIDEVQYAPGLFRFLKHHIDKDRHRYGQFILTGSQKFTLMKSVSESLAGRCAVCELETLALREIRQHHPDKPIEDLVLQGGFPELQARETLSRQDYFHAYLATYLERDVRSLLKVTTLRDFERFLRACALRSGQTVNKAELARDVGISSPTANEWLSVLHASNQVILLEPWFSNQTRSLAKSPKLYIGDTGLLCHLLNIRDREDLLQSPLLGSIWETFVFAELRKAETGSWDLWFWRDRRGLEVDFLWHKGGRFELAEAKWGANPMEKDVANMAQVARHLGLENVTKATVLSRTRAPYEVERNGLRAIVTNLESRT